MFLFFDHVDRPPIVIDHDVSHKKHTTSFELTRADEETPEVLRDEEEPHTAYGAAKLLTIWASPRYSWLQKFGIEQRSRMILRDTTEVACAPEAIFEFFGDMESRYAQWHPDHKLFRWVAGRGVAVGNVFHFEEVIAGKLLKKTVVFTRIEAHSHIEFAPTFWLMRLFLPRLLFRIEGAAPSVCRLVAEIHLRMGPLAARLNRRELDAVREHMRLEGINLKRIIENQVQPNPNVVDGASDRDVTV